MERSAPLSRRDHWHLVALMLSVQSLDWFVTRKLCRSGQGEEGQDQREEQATDGHDGVNWWEVAKLQRNCPFVG